MATKKSTEDSSPFNWQAAGPSVLGDQWKKNGRAKARLDLIGAKRAAATRGDLVKSGAPFNPKVKTT